MQKPTPPNASMMNAPQDAALRQEEFGDLSQAADQFDAAREYYAVALGQVRADDRATRARLLIKLAECDHRQGRYDRALAQLAEARTAARPLRDSHLNGLISSRIARSHVAAGAYRPGTRYARAAFNGAVFGRHDDHAGFTDPASGHVDSGSALDAG